MGAKAGLEYEAKKVCIDMAPLTRALDGMAAEGWTLASCSHPSESWAVLVFSRSRRADGG
jgi:hypothetical protein